MPNRTIYLPDELDQVSRRLKLNLSRVVQSAIRELAAELEPAQLDGQVAEAEKRAKALDLDWSDFSLAESRRAAKER